MTTPGPVRNYPADGRQLTVQMTQGGQPAAVVLGFKAQSGALDGLQAAAILQAAWTAFRPLIASEVVCTGGIYRDVSQAEGQAVQVPAPTSPAGAVAGTVAIAAGCTIIQWATARGGRSGRGRTYLPGLVTAAVNNDGRTYPAGTRTLVQDAIDNYLTAPVFTAEGVQPAVLSFTKGEANLITSGSPGTVVGVQRRRMRA